MAQWGKSLKAHGGTFLPMVDTGYTWEAGGLDDPITDIIMIDTGGLPSREAGRLLSVMQKSYLNQPYRKWLKDVGGPQGDAAPSPQAWTRPMGPVGSVAQESQFVSTMDDRVLQSLKAMAWERIKGELASIPAISYAPSRGSSKDWNEWEVRCERRREVVDAFIKTMNDEELYLA